MFSILANDIFDKVIEQYHLLDTVDQPMVNPYSAIDEVIHHLLYRKCWIDTVQWHMEDLIRLPNIDPDAALVLKRRIDSSNQDRTDTVEYIDSYFLEKYREILPKVDATINTESPAWAVDRLSILALKIYHMQEEVHRQDATAAHRSECDAKLGILNEQRRDLSVALDQLLFDIERGAKYMKVYRQMKMYNDTEMNPVLRSSQK